MMNTQIQIMDASNLSDRPDLAAIQRWMIASITSPEGLSDGLSKARRAHGWTVDDIIEVPEGISPHSRLDIYAQGYWLRLLACLKADYSALQRLLGEPLFDFFCRAYLTSHPSNSFSLYELGDGFSQFLHRSQSASIKSTDNGKLLLPLDLAKIEQAMAISLRAPGIENIDIEMVDPFNLLLGSSIEIIFPESTRLIISRYPLSTFQTLLDGNSLIAVPEVSTTFICVKRHQYHVSCQELADWQFYFLLSAKTNNRSLLECAIASARRTHQPIHEILAKLSLWLPAAQAESFFALHELQR